MQDGTEIQINPGGRGGRRANGSTCKIDYKKYIRAMLPEVSVELQEQFLVGSTNTQVQMIVILRRRGMNKTLRPSRVWWKDSGENLIRNSIRSREYSFLFELFTNIDIFYDAGTYGTKPNLLVMSTRFFLSSGFETIC